MTQDALAPTQLAYDRIQRAATRSPTNFPAAFAAIHIELCPDGIRTVGIKNSGAGLKTSHVTTWSELARCQSDPLWYAYVKVAKELGITIPTKSKEEIVRHAGM